jgi:two-component system CheB/CheR fusion protein
MGSDGLLGAKAIKENGGQVLVQEPTSAAYDGMPSSVVKEGIADLVAPPAQLAVDLMHLVSGELKLTSPEPLISEQERSSFERICILLRGRTGYDFSLYKKSTMYRRIERRMGIHAIGSISDYAPFLQGNPQELDLLFKELLIGVTSFFRDPEAWEQLAGEVLPGLISSRPEGGVLRAWVAGCSTGEEAYSLAITFKEVIEKLRPAVPPSLQVFSTDLDRDAIEKGRLCGTWRESHMPSYSWTTVSRKSRSWRPSRAGSRTGMATRPIAFTHGPSSIRHPS